MAYLPATKYYSGVEMQPFVTDTELEDNLHLIEYWKILKRRKWGVISFTILLALLGVLTALSLPKMFLAKATMLIEPETPKIVSLDPLQNSTNIMFFYETQYEIIRSRSLANSVIENLSLAKSPEFAKKSSLLDAILALLQHWAPPEYLTMFQPEQSPGALKESLFLEFQKRLHVKGEEKSQIVSVSFEASNPKLAADVANAIASAYMETGLESRLTMAKQAASWLTKRLDELREKVTVSEAALQKFQTSEGIVDSQSQHNIVKDRLASITSSLVKAQTDRVEAEIRFNQVRGAREAGKHLENLRAVLEDPLIQKLKEEESRLGRRVAELLERYGPKHPKMIAAKSDYNESMRHLKEEVSRVVDSIRKEYEVAFKNEQELQRAFESGYRKSPQDAVDAAMAREDSIARAAAERAYDDRNISDAAKLEVARAEAAADGKHLPEIPESPVVKRGKRQTDSRLVIE